MKKIAALICFFAVFVFARNPFCDPSDIDDDRDNRCYRTVRIGNQTWMAENLTYRENLAGGAWLLENVPGYWKIAVFYTWRAAMNACPDGWHLPSVREWETLFIYAGGRNNYGVAIKKLKSKGGWGSPKDGGNGTDNYGFSAFPVGMIYKDGTYMNNGGSTHFWTSTSGKVAAFPMASDYGGFNYFSSDNGYSVRCVKDY
ncbi:MAG: hypothetical protein II835_05855 [Fibrobacter sp.]|nr:hypothetical protein [Fibrobacter sp.]